MPRAVEGKYGYARYMGLSGFIAREYKPNGSEPTVVWWQPLGGGTEFMFSLRSDGVWRRFPSEAQDPGLDMGTARVRAMVSA